MKERETQNHAKALCAFILDGIYCGFVVLSMISYDFIHDILHGFSSSRNATNKSYFESFFLKTV